MTLIEHKQVQALRLLSYLELRRNLNSQRFNNSPTKLSWTL